MKKLKRIFATCLALCLIVATFASCSEKTTNDDKEQTTKKASSLAVKVIDIKLTEEDYAFGVDKNQPELLTEVNSFIAEIKESGQFDEICNKYFGDGTPTAVTSATLDESKNQLVVATNAAFEPFEYKNGDKYYGIDMEIAAALAKKLDKELVIQNMKFDSVCLSVGQHQCDIAMAGLTINEKREEYVQFSDAYYQASQKLIVKGDDTTFDKCETTADVEKILNSFDSKTKIGYQTGTTGEFYVKGNNEWGFDGFKVTPKNYDNGSLAVQDAINDNIDYVIIDEAPANYIVKSINALS
ncbi:MAG: transporter substrate-binding domain-containing protein [Clostridia bacterium]|nr:transporter substrate-binding domain-containing protein [Clostridia bacterium]